MLTERQDVRGHRGPAFTNSRELPHRATFPRGAATGRDPTERDAGMATAPSVRAARIRCSAVLGRSGIARATLRIDDAPSPTPDPRYERRTNRGGGDDSPNNDPPRTRVHEGRSWR